MSRYKNAKFYISEGQKKKLQDTIQTEGHVSIYFSYKNLNGNDNLALTKSQLN